MVTVVIIDVGIVVVVGLVWDLVILAVPIAPFVAAVIQCEYMLWVASCCISSFSSLVLSVIEIMGNNYRYLPSFLKILEPTYRSWCQRRGKTFNRTQEN